MFFFWPVAPQHHCQGWVTGGASASGHTTDSQHAPCVQTCVRDPRGERVNCTTRDMLRTSQQLVARTTRNEWLRCPWWDRVTGLCSPYSNALVRKPCFNGRESRVWAEPLAVCAPPSPAVADECLVDGWFGQFQQGDGIISQHRTLVIWLFFYY